GFVLANSPRVLSGTEDTADRTPTWMTQVRSVCRTGEGVRPEAEGFRAGPEEYGVRHASLISFGLAGGRRRRYATGSGRHGPPSSWRDLAAPSSSPASA